MVAFPKHIIGMAVFLLLAMPAAAQVCKESDSNSSSSSSNSNDEKHGYIDCDMTYRDTVVTCDPFEVQDESLDKTRKTLATRPSCPPKPMPMVKTPLKSYIADYSPYLYAYARDEKDPSKAYNGPFSVGTAGGADRVFGMIAQSADVSNRLAACVPQIQFSNHTNDVKEEAKRIRLQLDNCTNQYILNSAMYPYQKERSRLVDNPEISGDPISLATECQPLKTFDEIDNEYNAGQYLETAWKKLLQNPKHVKNKLSWTEPRMPKNLKLQHPMDPPDGLKEVRLSAIAAIPYEEILDPSHPFSPRWDFSFTERGRYSPLTDEYMKDTKNQVYCAGVRDGDDTDKDDSDFSTGKDEVSKEDKEVPVDVLKFRQKKFQRGILKRITYNTACKQDSGTDTASFFKNLATSYCHKPKWLTFVPCIVGSCNPQSTRVECWDCFKLDGKLDKNERPPCSTHYDEKDLRMKKGTPALFNGLIKRASCNPPPFFFRQKKHRIEKLCKDLRAPYTQINKLKMRYHNPDAKDYNAMKDGVPEGYTFKEYFGNHMPYPRLWDTGASLQKENASDNNDQPPLDVLGQYTAIVGVGREGAIEKADDDAKKKHKDERCKIGGWGGSQGFIPQNFGGADANQGLDGGLGNFGSSFGNMNVGNGGQGFDFNQFFGSMKGMNGFSGGGLGGLLGGLGGGMGGGGGMGSGMGGAGSGGGGGFSFGNFDFGGLGDQLGGMAGLDGMLDNMTGPRVNVGGYSIRLPDPITSWTELKLYQTRTLRNVNLSCIGRYEKVFKPGSSENLVLMASGGEWSRTIVQECPKDKSGDCKFMTLKEYKENNAGANTSNTYTIPQTKLENWPLSWRGYIATGTGGSSSMGNLLGGGSDNDQFPNFGGSSSGSGFFGGGSSTVTGLDKAELGDIVLMPQGASASGRKPGLAKVALVSEVNLSKECNKRKDCYVQVLEADNGKWPDTCGTTDASGEMKTRYYFKPGHLPKPAKEEYQRIRSTASCEDTKLAHCVFEPWSSVKLYRIRNDKRPGCDKETASECE